MDISQYFRETTNLLSPSCLPTNRCYSRSNTAWFEQFWSKKRRHQTLLYSGFSGKIGKVEYLRRYFNRITIPYKCGTWLIRFACLIKLYQITMRKKIRYFVSGYLNVHISQMFQFQPGWVILTGPTFCNEETKCYIYSAVKKTVILVSSFRLHQSSFLMFKHEWCIVRVTKIGRVLYE